MRDHGLTHRTAGLPARLFVSTPSNTDGTAQRPRRRRVPNAVGEGPPWGTAVAGAFTAAVPEQCTDTRSHWSKPRGVGWLLRARGVAVWMVHELLFVLVTCGAGVATQCMDASAQLDATWATMLERPIDASPRALPPVMVVPVARATPAVAAGGGPAVDDPSTHLVDSPVEGTPSRSSRFELSTGRVANVALTGT